MYIYQIVNIEIELYNDRYVIFYWCIKLNEKPLIAI